MGYGVKLSIVLMLGVCLGFLFMRMGAAQPEFPGILSMVATDPVDLNACSTVVIWCNATINDTTGWTDIDNVNATLWDDAAADEFDSDNDNKHYTNYSCKLNSGSGSIVQTNCTFTLQYYANPANWTCKVYANDSDGNTTSDSINLTVNSLIALDAENTIDFQTLNPGTTSSDDVNNTVTNCGNVAIDLNLSGTNLTNNSAIITNISVGSVKYNVTDYAQDYSSGMTALSATATYVDFSLAKRTNGASTSKTYWKVSVPSVIEDLIYTGTVTFTAVADS